MKIVDAVPTALFSLFVLLVSFVPSQVSIFQFSAYVSFKQDMIAVDLLKQRVNHIEHSQHEDAAARRSPWTHDPVCTTHLDALNSPLCIYTISTFNNNTGISIFTTPSIASSLTNLPVIASPTTPPPTTPPYRLASIPGKGHGLLATRHIPRLTPILTTHPVLLARTEMVLSTPEREHHLRLALSQLPPSTQKAYYNLVRLYDIESFAAQDVVRANSFEIGLSSPPTINSSGSSANHPTHKHSVLNNDGTSTAMHLAIFPEAARLNHACNPNAMYYLDPDTLTHAVHATRDISVGAEVTVSYIGVMQGLGARRRMLREGFGFWCGCGRCEREEKIEEEGEGQEGGGEDMLGKMRSYEAWLKLWVMGEVPMGWEGVDMREEQVEEILSMYRGMFEEEGLEGFMDEAYKMASATEWLLGKEGKAKEYGRAASEVMAMRYGPKHRDVDRWRDPGTLVVEEYIKGLRG